MAFPSPRFQKWTRLQRGLALWLAALCGLAVVSAPGFWFMGVGWSFLLFMLAAPLVGLAGILLISAFVVSWRERRTPLRAVVTALSPPIVLALGFALFLPITWGTHYVMTCAVFLVNHAKYERIIDQVAQASKANEGVILDERLRDGTLVYAERRAPHRVIFELSGWNSISSGILFDPTGLGGSGPAVGEELVGPCLPIFGGYYSCSFDTG